MITTFQSLRDPACSCPPEGRPFPVALDPFTCNRFEIAEFAKAAYAMGVRYLGVCCGAGPHHIRALAEALGRRPPASRYSPDMSRHSYFGTDPTITAKNREYAERLWSELSDRRDDCPPGPVFKLMSRRRISSAPGATLRLPAGPACRSPR
jgi:hypothetical protein